jgi:imidazolonepropionase-like amidohydrolase
LVSAGHTTAEALRSTTIEPAKYLDAAESLGTIEAGKIADLVLRDANPLADVRNVRKVAAVVWGGKYLSKSRLQALTPHH